MKQPCNYTLDPEVIAGIDRYLAELVKALPVSMQKNTRMKSQVVNDILREFLQNKGFLNPDKEKVS